MSPRWLSVRRRPLDAWLTWIGASAVFIAVTAVVGGKPYAIYCFVFLCGVVSYRPRLTPVIVVVFFGPLVGLFSWPQAGVAAGLMLLRPALDQTTAAVAAAIKVWREDDTPIGHAACVRLVRPWVQGIVIVSVVIAAMVEGGWFVGGIVEVMALIIPLWAYQRSHHTSALVLSVVASVVTGWSVAPVVLGGFSLTIALFTLSTSRLPRRWHPLPAPNPWRRPLLGARCHRCDRRIARGDILGARRALGSGHVPWLRFRHAFLDLEERSYQSALSLVQDESLPAALVSPAKILRGRALSGIAMFEQARFTYLETLSEAGGRLHEYLVLLLAENDLAAGNTTDAVKAASWLAARPPKTREYFMHQRALRVLAEYELDQQNSDRAACIADQAMEDLIRNRAVARLVLTSHPHRLVRRIYGNRGSTYIYTLKAAVLDHAATAPTDQTDADEDEEHDGWNPEATAMAMAVAQVTDDLIELYLSEARTAAATERRAEALPLVARALMELDRTRYLLAAQSSRSSWSKRFRRVLDFALAVAHDEGDHEFVAELLEFARVQTLPTASAEASSELALSTPPVVLVKGRSRLARPGEQRRPVHVSLEVAAQRSAGTGAWWLSYWDSGDWLYWALMDPLGATSSGRIDFGLDSVLRTMLGELERALPAPLPGEDPIAADFRIADSPLLTDPVKELELSEALGDLLLPRELVRAAVDRRIHGGTRLPLAIAPIAALGYIPWSILVAADLHSADPDRLVELCDWVLAPSAALVCNTAARSPGRAPLALAVADTSDGPGLGELRAARSQAASLPASVRVLGGHHWASDLATLRNVEDALRAIGPDSTVAFLCHAVRGTVDEPSTGGLVLALDRTSAFGPGAPVAVGTVIERYDVLSPLRIFDMSRRGLTMPAQVLLQACDTSAVKDAVSGEWLTIAPAFVAAGSREVVATVYPLPDLPGTDDPVMHAALNGESLREAAGRLQREGLLRWTTGHSTEAGHTPLAWGAYATIAVRPPVDASSESESSPRPVITDSFVRVMGDAIRDCLRTRRKRLDSGWIISSMLEDGGIADLFDGGGSGLRPMAFIWTLGPYLCSRYLRIRDRGPYVELLVDGVSIRVSGQVVDALRDGQAAADRDGLPLTPHQMVLALLVASTAARRILRLLTTLARRSPTLIHRAIEFELTRNIAEGLRTWTRSTRNDTNRDIIETLLTHVFPVAKTADVRPKHVA